MSQNRKIQMILKSKPTMEGAGVRLKRAFGFNEVPQLDPFLMLDDFHSDNPDDYIEGFPWHPHRGIETITYMLHGKVSHEDSMGNKGVIQSGDVQWMTAGSGIIHQEMPLVGENSLLWGFQLWANLPAGSKMMAPRYQDITSAQIPEITLDNGARIRIICGEVNGVTGPIQDIIIDPQYLDISLPPNTEYTHPVKAAHTVFAYVVDGKGGFGRDRKPSRAESGKANESAPRQNPLVEKEHLVVFDKGDQVYIATGTESFRFILLSGKPIGEPIAWHGPIVMNTQEELTVAFEEYQNGTFLKHKQ